VAEIVRSNYFRREEREGTVLPDRKRVITRNYKERREKTKEYRKSKEIEQKRVERLEVSKEQQL
jgi:hypothetical protein